MQIFLLRFVTFIDLSAPCSADSMKNVKELSKIYLGQISLRRLLPHHLKIWNPLFLRSNSSKEFGIGSAQLAFFLFVLMVNIVVANLLIGLTVNKTDELLKQAEILRLQKIVNQINAIESVIGTESWQQSFICHMFHYF